MGRRLQARGGLDDLDTGMSNWIATAVAARTFEQVAEPEERRDERGAARRRS